MLNRLTGDATSFRSLGPTCGDWLRVRDPQPTPGLAEVVTLAREADRLGYDLLYVPENHLNAVHGPSAPVLDAWVVSSAAASATDHIGIVTACQPGPHAPRTTAKMIATLASLPRRNIGVSCVAGWWPLEAESHGEPFLDHADRYARLSEFIDVMRGLWAQPRFDYEGRFYQCRGAEFAPKPANPPTIFIAGESAQAIDLAARIGDYLFINGSEPERVANIKDIVRARAHRLGRDVKIALSAFVVLRSDLCTAENAAPEWFERADLATIAYFDRSIDPAVIGHRRGVSADKIDANLGLRSGLIGDPATLLQRIAAFEQAGVDLLLIKFDAILTGLQPFARTVVDAYGKTP